MYRIWNSSIGFYLGCFYACIVIYTCLSLLLPNALANRFPFCHPTKSALRSAGETLKAPSCHQKELKLKWKRHGPEIQQSSRSAARGGLWGVAWESKLHSHPKWKNMRTCLSLLLPSALANRFPFCHPTKSALRSAGETLKAPSCHQKELKLKWKRHGPEIQQSSRSALRHQEPAQGVGLR